MKTPFSILYTCSFALLCSCSLAPASPRVKDSAGSQGKDPTTTQEKEKSTAPDSKDAATTSEKEAPTSAPEDTLEDSQQELLQVQLDKSSVWFIGAKEAFERVGTFRKVEGSARVRDGILEELQVELPTSSVNTPFVRLTKHMLNEDFFDVEKYPLATFRSTSIRQVPPQDEEEGLPNYEIKGDLTILAVTKNIDYRALVQVGDAGLVHRASFFINRKDFGMNYDGKPEDPIFDEVKLEIDLSFGAGF